jgi:pimeloyl-ACP methyl ester carboxylesterase
MTIAPGGRVSVASETTLFCEDRVVGLRWEEETIATPAGRKIGYLTRGPAQGRSVVYLHGAPGSRREQRVIPDAVLDRFGVRLVSLDRPGYGATDPLAGDRVARVADVIALCDALGIDRFPVIAFSSGGTYALTLAAVAPDRVERVVLVSAQMPYDDELAIEGLLPNQLSLLPALRAARREQLIAGFGDARSRMLGNPVASISEIATLTSKEQEWFAPRQEIFVDDLATGLGAGVDGLLDDLLAWPHPFEVDVGSLRCPVRAVHGALDDSEPIANLRRVLAMLQDTQLFLLDGLSHVGPLMYPDLFISLAVSGD